MLATISPANIHLDETLATLRYAGQARTIVNRMRVNEDPHDRLIRELQAEVKRLRALREDYERQMKIGVPRRLLQPNMTDLSDKDHEIEILKEQLKQTEGQLRQSEEMAKAQKSWTERLEEAGKQKSAELNHLQRCGVALKLDWKQQSPCIVNLIADPSLSGTLLYLLPVGVVHIGRLGATTGDQQPDIALSGPLVQPHHCTIENKDSKLTLIPGCGSETFVNGELVKERTDLHHGDRLVIGGNHYFRVSNPYDRSITCTGQLVDYEFAHQEILKVQEKKLQAELNEAKRQAIQELEEVKKEAKRQLGCQRMNYEEQLKQMGITLEEQKNVLSIIQSKKDELETQNNILEAEAQKRKAAHETTTDFILIPYRSDFLKEIEAALNETVVENENILKLETSLSENSECTGLHELIVAVQEANQRCRELHINLEFHQQHIIGQSGLEPTVRVCDTLKHLAAFWKPENFLQWLYQLRDYEPNDNLKELLHIDLSWEADDWKGEEEDAEAHNSSRILVNMHQIKQQLSDNIQHVSMKLSCNDSDYTHNVNNCLQQMEAAANRLYSLCKNQGELEKINVPLESLDGSIQQLRSVLGTSHSQDISSPMHQGDSSENSPHLSGNSPKRKCFPWPLSYGVPRKSNLRSPCPIRTSQTQKAVRFFLTTSQEDQSPE